uniref:Protein lifeguard 1 n=1 Tax=Macrostomum lignano TaxID=282301 RepID=A0A1I8GI27_9PLAT
PLKNYPNEVEVQPPPYPAEAYTDCPQKAGAAQAQGSGTGGIKNEGFSNQPGSTGDVESGATNEVGEFAIRGLDNKEIRRGFIRKVYLILFAQLLVTFTVVIIFSAVKPVKQFARSNLWLFHVSYGIFIIMYFALVCITPLRRKFPGNFISLAIFTASLSFMTGVIASCYQTNTVAVCLGVTAAVCLGVTLFAVQTRYDFTMCSGLLLVVFLFGLSCLVTFFVYRGDPNFSMTAKILDCVYGGLLALLFVLFLIFDTQRVVGGRRHDLSEEEYVYGAMQIYVDVVYIFLILLGFSRHFSDPAMRRGFITRVYAVLMLQLLVTGIVVSVFTFSESVKKWVHTNLLFYYISFGLFIVVYLVIMCCKSVRRRFPCNMICLSIFTLAFSYMTGCIASFYNTQGVLIAMGICSIICIAISIFAVQTKIDFTMCSGLILVISLVFILFALACSISYAVVGASRLLDCVYGGVGALVFSIFLVYDTQQVVGGRKYELSPEEYVSGAMQLYLDVVYIFIYLLPLGSSN